MSPHLDPTRSTDPVLELSAALAPRYRLERAVGRRGPASVYLATTVERGRQVAVKVLPPLPPAGADRFVRELETATGFRHPAALPILDAGALELATGAVAPYYIVPEVSGENLRTRLEREGLLPVSEAVRYAADLAGALAAAHGAGLTHGGVRAENVVLAGSRALLTDLGVARALARAQSPDPLGDVRALGRLLYEMLSGKTPPAGLGAPPPVRTVRRSVPEEIELIVAQALAPEPADAWPGAAEMAEALQAAADRVAPVAGLTTSERAAMRQRLSPRWGFFSLAVLAVLGVTLWLRYTAPPGARAAVPAPRPTSLAVLPLVNASPDTATEFMSDGMTEELITALGRVPGLRVAGAASSFTLDGRVEDAQRAGRRLGAGAVLEGSVRQAGARLRLMVHLVSVREGFDLWSETYERNADDLFVVQDEIVRGVAEALRVRPPPASAPPTRSLEAHRRFLQARYAVRQSDADHTRRALALYQEAVALDSGFAAAWAGLAEALLQRAVTEGARPEDVMPRADSAAQRALALDPTLAAAHVTLGVVRFLHDWRWDAAEAELQRAITLNPNLADADHWYSHLLLALGRPDESLARSRRALGLEPVDPATRVHLGWHYLFAGLLPEAEAALERARLLDSSSAAAALYLGLVAERRQDYPLAESRYRQGLAAAPDHPPLLAALGRVHALAGRPAEARAVLQQLDSLSASRYVSPYELATVAEALDDRRHAFAWLDAAVADRAPALVYLAIDPRLDRLRNDRRFARIARAVGLPPPRSRE